MIHSARGDVRQILLMGSVVVLVTACSGGGVASSDSISPTTVTTSPSPSAPAGLASASDDYCWHSTADDKYNNCVTAFIWGALAAGHDRALDAATIEEGITYGLKHDMLTHDYNRKDLIVSMEAGRDWVLSESS